MQTLGKNNQLGNLVQNVKGRLADDGEIQVEVPNAFFDFYKNAEGSKNAFTTDGWYCTNAIAKYRSTGLVLETKKDSKKELVTTENLIATDIKMVIEGKCHYISSSIIVGAGQDYPVAILFPNDQMQHPQYDISPLDGCFCPRDVQELNKCLTGCLNDANCEIGQKFAKIKTFLIVEIEKK